MKSVYLLFEVDAWHSYDSMTLDSLICIATSKRSLKQLIKKRLQYGHKDDIIEFIKQGEFKSPKEFIDKAIEGFFENNMQTQSLSKYLGIEFHAELVDVNMVI